MDFFQILSKVAPWVAAAAEGPPGLIAMAAKTVGQVLGQQIEPSKDAIAAAVANVTDPQVLLQIKAADDALKVQLQQAGFAHEKDMRLADIEEQKVYVEDTADARAKFAADRGVYWLGIAVLTTFAGAMSGLLWICYQLLTDGIKLADQGVVAVVFSLIGTIVGYLASNAQQVVGYFYGSSKGATERSRDLASAVQQLSKP